MFAGLKLEEASVIESSIIFPYIPSPGTIGISYISGWWLGHPSEKYESQLGWLFPIYGKTKNVPNHQPDIDTVLRENGQTDKRSSIRHSTCVSSEHLPHIPVDYQSILVIPIKMVIRVAFPVKFPRGAKSFFRGDHEFFRLRTGQNGGFRGLPQ